MFLRRTNELEKIRARGFLDGTQDIGTGNATSEIKAAIAKKKNRVEEKLARRIGRIDTRLAVLRSIQWPQIDPQKLPPIVLPLIAIVCAVAAIFGEAVLLAPVMDGFGIGDPSAQLLTASILILVCSGLLKISLELIAGEKPAINQPTTRSVVMSYSLGVLSLVFVTILGFWRSSEMVFAFELGSSNPDLGFMLANKTLTTACVVLVTIGLPIFAAIAGGWGLRTLADAKTSRGALRAKRKTERLTKAIDGLRDATSKQGEVLVERANELVSAYNHSWDLGKKIRARKSPIWQLRIKVSAFLLVTMSACILADPKVSEYVVSLGMRLSFYVSVSPGLTGIYLYRALKARERPNEFQLYKQKAIEFTD